MDEMNKSYDRGTFIKIYIRANHSSFIHDDFKNYYTGLFKTLQQAFGITISRDGITNTGARHVWILFSSTVNSYVSIRHPRDIFLVDDLIESTLNKFEEANKRMKEIESRIFEANLLSKQAHLQLLEELFLLLWGPVDKIITSTDLLQLGFDDSLEPDPQDYIDYL